MRKTASCWLLDRIHESVRMLPVRLALCDLEAPGWGPWFPHCASVAFWLTDCCMALCGLLFRFCFALPYQSLRWYNVIILFLHFPIAHELISWLPAVLVFVFVLVVLFAFSCSCLFCLFLFFWCLLFVLHGDSMGYVLYHIVIMTNVAIALIRWICTMQLSFRLDKRPGESHLALDGKKVSITLGNWIKTYHGAARSSAEWRRIGECCLGAAALQSPHWS